ncbi:hypothetical protein ScPMuIL_004999 [Solemya velum]
MNVFLFFSLILPYVLAMTPTPCCWAPQYEATIFQLGGYVDPTYGPIAIDGGLKMYYDSIGKRMRVESTFRNPDGSLRRTRDIVYPEKGMGYHLNDDGSCLTFTYVASPFTDIHCINRTATFTGQQVLGSQTSHDQVNSFRYQGRNTTVLYTTTENCNAPVRIALYGAIGQHGEYGARADMYSDYYPGIHDPSIFDPPTTCSEVPVGR